MKFLLLGGCCGGVGAWVYCGDDLVGFAEYGSCSGRAGGRRGGGLGFIDVYAQRTGRYGRLVPGCVCDWVLVRVPLFFEKKISPDALITGRLKREKGKWEGLKPGVGRLAGESMRFEG